MKKFIEDGPLMLDKTKVQEIPDFNTYDVIDFEFKDALGTYPSVYQGPVNKEGIPHGLGIMVD